MNKKIILLTIFGMLLLSSCGSEELVEETNEKKDFLIETMSYSELSNEAILKKTGIISSSQDISLNSNANGRVNNIFVKQGDNVVKGQLLATLDDNIANYYLNVASTKNALASAENGLQVAKNNYEKLEINFETTKLNLDKSIADLERNLKNLNVENLDSSSSLELEKIENSLARLEIEYNNLLLSNNETLTTFKKNIEKEFIVLRDFLYDITYFSDEILGVTPGNKNKNDSFETFLGAKDSGQKIKTENLLRNLITKKDYIDKLEVNFNDSTDYQEYLDELNLSYDLIIEFLRAFDQTLSNSIESAGSLSKAEIDGFKAKVSGFRASYNGYKTQLIGLENNISSFLETYQNTEQSLLKNIENLEKDKGIYVRSLDLEIENMEATLEEAKKSRDLTLRNLEIGLKDSQTSIKDAEIRVEDANIAYSQAIKQADKLNITSPISGIISDIMIDEGQELGVGTPSFKILSETNNEINISFTKDELSYVYEGKDVYYKNDNITYTGSIYSIAQNADENLKYVAKVKLPNQANYIGNIIEIEVPIELSNKLISLDSIKINNSGIGTINYYSSGSINTSDLQVGDIYGEKVEILDEIDENTMIITSYVDNFDKEKFNLKIKNKIDE